MNSDFIPVNEPLLDGNEKKYLLECIESGWISSEGPFVQQFEDKFAISVNRKHAIAVTNGTAAIDVAIDALGLGRGDEVIVPTFTIISCLLQIVRSGATPVLVDADPVTWSMDVNQIERKITARTKAIMAVHIYGIPVDMKPLAEIGSKYGLKIIEDAAELYGQTYMSKPCGSFGDISTFSFYPNKHITTGEGGMIVTDDDDLAKACRDLRNLCFQSEKRFVHKRLGWNLRMTNMQAAIGLAQLERIDEFVNKKRAMGAMYSKFLDKTPNISLPIPSVGYAENIYWVFGIVISDQSSMNGSELIARLASQGVGCRPFFYPMHMQPVFNDMGLFLDEKYPVSEKLYRKGLYLPSGLALLDKDIKTVSEKLHLIMQDELN